MCPRVLHFRDFTYLRVHVRVVSVSVSMSVLHRQMQIFESKSMYESSGSTLKYLCMLVNKFLT